MQMWMKFEKFKTPKTFSFLVGAALAIQLIGNASNRVVESKSLYDEIYPYYAEFCAVTKITPFNGSGGGIGGHGVLFIKGACLDTKANYPRLKVCDEGAIDPTNPESGTFISVDSMYKNVNWVGIEGKKLMMNGGLPPKSVLDQATLEKVIADVLARGYFRGIELHPVELTAKPAAMSVEEWNVRQSIGTDFAMNFGRNLYCSRLPISREMVAPMVDYLNSRNDEYASGRSEYNWSGVYNNCTHTTRNALAAAGLYSSYGTDEFILRQAFNMAIPMNEFIEMMETGSDGPLDDIVRIYHDPIQRNSLLQSGWLPTQPGVLTENLSIVAENSLYDTTPSDILILQLPLAKPKTHALKRILKDKRYSEIEANLRFFQEKLHQARLELQAPEQIFEEHPELRQDQTFAAFYERFDRYLDEQTKKVEAGLQRLELN